MTSQVAITLLKSLEQSLDSYCELNKEGKTAFRMAIESLELFGNSEHLPSAQPEPLTDKEQRIFLAAMEREKKVCEEIDRNYVREPYEDSLIQVCREIIRKVKGALWT